ncbi:DUF1330 domain-containing protein [Rhizobium halophytocola]|uniref:Uncharacterized protein (DUF1330 family) n=1 Tax=Rhizobium halophytocola TaxID=735519 RepID=A0ABS4DWK0_9HYPH|nr:DUF1330 domain-containing protein [Rhizobium halophytocola]MBP1850047.1 uncharacterized protein (DUF1330 family) [Rhizobium halophytocola]
MPAYVVFTRENTTDRSALDTYSADVKDSFAGRDVAFLAAYGPHETLEGPPIEGAVILEFADMTAARDWYHSPAYQQAAEHRFRGAKYRAFIVEGQ